MQIYKAEDIGKYNFYTLFKCSEKGKYIEYDSVDTITVSWLPDKFLINVYREYFSFKYMGKVANDKYEEFAIDREHFYIVNKNILDLRKLFMTVPFPFIESSVEYKKLIKDLKEIQKQIESDPRVLELSKKAEKYYTNKYGHLISQKTK